MARAGVGHRLKETLAAGQLHLLVKLYLTFCALQVKVTVASRPTPNLRGHVIYLLGLITEVVPRRPFPLP